MTNNLNPYWKRDLSNVSVYFRKSLLPPLVLLSFTEVSEIYSVVTTESNPLTRE